MLPLQVPGGPELLVIALILLILLAVIGGIIGGIIYLGRRRRNNISREKQRIKELEQRVAELELTRAPSNESEERNDHGEM